MIKKLFVMTCLLAAVQQLKAQVVEIKPEYPQRGEKVTVIYHPRAKAAIIGASATIMRMQFSSSTFYDLSWDLPMVKKGNDWVASFVPQRYATFASFYFQSGKLIDKPANGDYTIAVYKGKKRVKDGYYHESFSIKSQMPKAANLMAMQMELLRKELLNYPDNYEAQIRLQSLGMEMAVTPEEKSVFRNAARRIIAARFAENPTLSANVDRVKMGYRMIAEPSRIDSIRKVITGMYPESEPARMYAIASISKERDTLKKVQALEALLNQADTTITESALAIHKLLFQYYAAAGNASKAVYHAQKSFGPATPYTPKELKDVAAMLTAKALSPATASGYAERALSKAGEWPVGLIRFFPEFGYIPCFVEDSTRRIAVAEAKSSLYSIIALNKLYLGDRTAALHFAAQALPDGANGESLMNTAKVFAQLGDAKKAYDLYWQLILKNPLDSVAIESARNSFLKFNASEADFTAKLRELEALKKKNLQQRLLQQRLDLPGPELKGITDLNGKPFDAALLKGKVVVMDFWATWCVPCMKELPYLQKVYDQYKNNPDVVFMVINSGSGNTIDNARDWAKMNTQYSFPLFFNHDKHIGEKVGFTLIPTVAMLDANGKMQFRTIGFEGAEMETKLALQIEILLEAGNKK